MAGPRPDDPYTGPTESVSPSTQAPDDMLSVRANPNEMGAQFGAAVEKAGQQQQQATNEQTDLAVQYQGMLNETASTFASSSFSDASSDIHGQYKSLKGLDAVAQLPAYKQQIHDAWQQNRQGLNMAAQRAYDMMTLRQQNLIYQDMATYSATQIKEADVTAAKASRETAINSASNLAIPMQDVTGHIKFDTNHIFTSDSGYAVGVSGQDAKTGELTFTNDENGQRAQAAYNLELDAVIGAAWKNRITQEGSDPSVGNWVKASQDYEANKNDIPAAARAEISAMLQPKVRGAQARSIADSVIDDAHRDYYQELGQRESGNVTPSMYLGITSQQESHGGLDKSRGVNKNQVQAGTWAQYAKPGEHIDNDKDNDAVALRYINDLWKDPKINGDPSRVAVAYFSGASNVNPDLNSTTPWIDGTRTDASGKSVESYVDDIRTKLGVGAGAKNGGFFSFSDYLRLHEADIADKAGDKYSQIDPSDVQGFDETRSLALNRTGTYLKTQEDALKVGADNILDFIAGQNSNGQPITDPSLLESPNVPENIRQEWRDLQTQLPFVAQSITTKLISAQLRLDSLGYGTDFWRNFNDVVDGKLTSRLDVLKTGAVGDAKTSPLTPNSLTALSQMFGDTKTPAGRNHLEAERNFFKTIRQNYTATGTAAGVVDSKGDGWFTNVMIQGMDLVREGRAKGLTDDQMFNKKNTDTYIGNQLPSPDPIAVMKNREMAVLAAGMRNKPAVAQQPKPADEGPTVDPKNFIPAGNSKYYPNLKALHAAVADPSQGLTQWQAIQYSIANHLVKQNPPPVPKPQ